MSKFWLYIFSVLFAMLFFSNAAVAVEKRSIGILPFENLKNEQRYEWINFGLQYLLSNKLANVSAFYVPDQSIIKKVLAESAFSSGKINGDLVYRIGRETGINIGITGSYATNGQNLIINLNVVNSFNGASILSKQYSQTLNDIFSIADDIAQNILNLAAVTLTPQEQAIVSRRITSSPKAFEYFCLGYIENEKANKQMEIITGLFRQAIREDSKFWEAFYNLGIAYFNNHEYDNALQQFDIIIKSLPNFEKPYFGRALIYMRKEDYNRAKADFTKVTEFNPNDYKPFYYLGSLSGKLKQYKEAEDYLNKATELNPDFADTYAEMGNIFFDQNLFRQAITHYKRAAELDPSNYTVKQKLGESYYRVQTYYSAYAEFKKILEVYPTDPAANFMLGITAYKQAVLSELIEAFLEMFDPNLAEEQRQRSKAGSSVRERTDVYHEMARSFYTAQKASNGFLEATFNLALTYHEMNQLDSAKIYYEKSIQIQPDLIRAHIKLAKLYEEKGEKGKSLAKYKEVVEIDPTYFAVHPTLGPFHNYINIIEVVLSDLDKVLKERPEDLSANLTLAKIYYAQGFHGKAANVFRKVLTINPNEPEAKKMLAQLERR